MRRSAQRRHVKAHHLFSSSLSPFALQSFLLPSTLFPCSPVLCLQILFFSISRISCLSTCSLHASLFCFHVLFVSLYLCLCSPESPHLLPDFFLTSVCTFPLPSCLQSPCSPYLCVHVVCLLTHSLDFIAFLCILHILLSNVFMSSVSVT